MLGRSAAGKLPLGATGGSQISDSAQWRVLTGCGIAAGWVQRRALSFCSSVSLSTEYTGEPALWNLDSGAEFEIAEQELELRAALVSAP